jgi:hypothetical protein
MLGSYSMYQSSNLLLEKLKSSGAISETDTFVTIRKNKNLIDTITKLVAHELSIDIHTSVYGLGIISDFDLYFNLNTFININEIVPQLTPEEKGLTYNKLRKSLLNLNQFVRRQRDKVILHFKLQKTPIACMQKMKTL